MPDKKIDHLREQISSRVNAYGSLFVEIFHYFALFAIGAVIAWAAISYFLHMFETGKFDVDGILQLFIYLELGAMVGIYFRTNRMPVRYLIYIAITALTRLMISDVSHHEPGLEIGKKILIESGAILLLAFAVLVVRYASSKFPNDNETDA